MLEGDEVRTLTFGEAWELLRLRADSLSRLGLMASQRLALAPRNDIDSVLTALAALALGAHVWMVNPDDPGERLQRQLTTRRPNLVLGDIAGAEALSAPRDPAPDLRPALIDPASAAFLFNTSGSTGVPKAVIQSHAAVIANARSFTSHHGLTPGRMILGLLPIHHVNAVHSNLMSTLYSGAECFLLRPDSLLRLHRWIESSNPYLVSLVPSIAEALLTSWRRPHVPPDLHHVLSAAAPLSARTAREFQQRFDRRIIQGYGLSETMNFSTTMPIDLDGPTYSALTFDAERPSVGRALPGVDLEVRSPSGTPVPDGVVGEVFVRGHHLMTGYDDDPQSTGEVLTDGWFRTGDLGYQRFEKTAGTCLFLTGRNKNVAKVHGEQIALEEVENALLMLPGVLDAACGTETDERRGERIVAGLVGDRDLDLSEIRQALAHLLPPYGIPTHIVSLRRIPRTPTGKILRADLASLLASEGRRDGSA
jgi:acyl-CoA synthetase (AMP-forming)/AMP-acid ligase II